MNANDFSISLRIRGGVYNGQGASEALFSSREVSEALGLRPWVVRAADRHKLDDVKSDTLAAYWSHRFSFDPELELDEALVLVADKVHKHTKTFHELSKKGLKLELFVGLTFTRSSGHELDWNVLAKLAEAKVGLSLDLYCEEADSGDMEKKPSA